MLGTIPSGTPPLHARVVIAGGVGGFRGDVELSALGQTNTRGVSGESCRGVSDAIALIVMLAVNPDAAIEPSPSPPPAPSFRPRLVAGASALLEVGLLPSSSVGGEVAAGIGAGRIQVEALGALVASRSATLASRPLEGSDFTLRRIGARGCYELMQTPVRLGPCLGVGAEWVRGQGFGSKEHWPAEGLLGTLSLGARFAVDVGSGFALRLCAEQITALHRLTFVIDDAGTVFTTPLFAFRGTLGAEFRF